MASAPRNVFVYLVTLATENACQLLTAKHKRNVTLRRVYQVSKFLLLLYSLSVIVTTLFRILIKQIYKFIINTKTISDLIG